jgi:hypothetical protein
MRLRTGFTLLDATESEFRAIYKAHESVKDVLYPMSSGGMVLITQDVTEKRRQAATQINEQLKATLGEARFAQYQRATDSDFQQLYRLGQRENVPYDTLVRAHDVRGPAADASVKILEDTTLEPDAKRAALKELAQQARTTLLSTLGPSVGPAYVANSRWLMYLDQGRAVTVGPDGTTSTRSVPMSVPPRPQTPSR